VLIVVGSRNLAHFDAALVGYTFSVLFATFGLTYRYAMWLQRPPTASTGAAAGRRSSGAAGDGATPAPGSAAWVDVLANRFIFARDRLRGLTHMLIMWGCLIAVAITFPLVFGWLYFRPSPAICRSTRRSSSASRLPVSARLDDRVLPVPRPGVVVVPGDRRRDAGDAAAHARGGRRGGPAVRRGLHAADPPVRRQPHGADADRELHLDERLRLHFIAILHAITVIGTFLWLPFGKFFHIFQRPAQLGVGFYKDVGRSEELAHCRRCGHAFSSRMHVEDLIEVERQLGLPTRCPASDGHYQWICPPAGVPRWPWRRARCGGAARRRPLPAAGRRCRCPSTPIPGPARAARRRGRRELLIPERRDRKAS
jgi:hypothetical protein